MKLIKKFDKYFENTEHKDVSEEVDKIHELVEEVTDYKIDNYTEDGKIVGFELNTYTDGGVNMIVFIDLRDQEVTLENFIEEFERYIDDFDIDSTIEMHRQEEDYKKAFTLRESLNDFENYLGDLKKNLEEMKSKFGLVQTNENLHSTYDFEDKTKSYPVKNLDINKCDVVEDFPNFHKSGSVKGMKRKYYGNNALLVKCGDHIYNVTDEPRIYFEEAN